MKSSNIIFLYISWAFFSLIIVDCQSQTKTHNSLKFYLKNKLHDTVRCGILKELIEKENEIEVWKYYNEQLIKLCEQNLRKGLISDPSTKCYERYLCGALVVKSELANFTGGFDSAVYFSQKALGIARKVNNPDLISHALNALATTFYQFGKTNEALLNWDQCLKIQQAVKDDEGIANTYNNLGSLYQKIGRMNEALHYLERSLQLREKFGDQKGISESMNNLATYYYNQGDPETALKYFKENLNRLQVLGERSNYASTLNNIAGIQLDRNETEEALKLYFDALKIHRELDDHFGVVSTLNNIGSVYAKLDKYLEAIDFFEQGLKLSLQLGNKDDACIALNFLGSIYIKQNNFKDAVERYKQSSQLANETGFIQHKMNATEGLYNLYRSMGRAKEALENYEVFIQLRDSVNNESTRKASIRSQLKYEYEKQAAADSVAHAKESEIKNAELAKQKAEISAKKNQQYALFGGLFCVCVFGVFMYNRFKVTQKQKGIIEEQKNVVEEQKKLVEEKQKEILDSIHYARRIQMAQVPSEKRVSSILKKLRS